MEHRKAVARPLRHARDPPSAASRQQAGSGQRGDPESRCGSCRRRVWRRKGSIGLSSIGLVLVCVCVTLVDWFGGKVPGGVGAKPITCGSAIYLKHADTGFKLFSAGINWGSGSGQQAVTAQKSDEADRSLLWLVKEGMNLPGCHTGAPIKCGDVIRLEHLDTEKNVHSHAWRSPVSGMKEVSVFGSSGVGDVGDNFIVECGDKKAEVWERGKKVALKHEGLPGYLRTTAKHKFTQANCPRCPILGHQEVAVAMVSKPSSDDYWLAYEGVLISSADDEDEEEDDSDRKKDKDEL
ncbi:unnamed protein product [Vitrella brassicaformis CCMP3155]|uniref:MIR domain-containing protein n=1 Tax=Vitrella brassicaformis (strain CCMP3155) TaxID=1169540 RepID=A0A0G4ERD3_VITBC|nr:unnamed protein product [Vitrella brassicaformis CCMP3155]|mmetsp:Transcript_18121/g.43640  ORF Transcript_18121/g.43640 Transcript_18121/m.43640 type:complete len:294 (-) Transcript_18121:1595-2476(-)|eukprot:CEM00828.1 unnamed protein product [Vitrella brassicaformis CCMP3155]